MIEKRLRVNAKMEQCKGLTKRGFRCKLKTTYGYCRFHKETEEGLENADKIRITNELRKFITVNERTKQVHISREFKIDEFIEQEKMRRDEMKQRIVNELGYGLYGLELKEVIEKNLQKIWKKKQIIRLMREELTKEKMRREESMKNKIDFYFVKIDKIRKKEEMIAY